MKAPNEDIGLDLDSLAGIGVYTGTGSHSDVKWRRPEDLGVF